ncbi:hypothetical protein WICMUC_002133 [Wickerhamomyces mucosus]|uniref:U6 snRNA phosphodiesterase 1 n=1 Tax=Wickerhamomyces mucosus TaxID=1378264 RepID=A0A9P8PQB5_9ASCO|nr:hypothetical protein WICMUC_002133 [Wickerhamomyces mucosus]
MNNIKNYYSDSDSDSDQDQEKDQEEIHRPKKLQKLPPLPDIIQDQFYKSANFKNIDSKSMRFFNPEILGKTSQHIFNCLEFLPTKSQCQYLTHTIEDINMLLTSTKVGKLPKFQPLYESGLNFNIPLHVSLSPNIIMPSTLSQLFKERLQNKLKSHKLSSKVLKFDKLVLFPNLTGSSLFATLDLSKDSKENLSEILQIINESLEFEEDKGKLIKMLGKPFDKNSLHVSFAESPNIAIPILDNLNFWNEEISIVEINKDFQFEFDSLKITDGLSRLSIPLK